MYDSLFLGGGLIFLLVMVLGILVTIAAILMPFYVMSISSTVKKLRETQQFQFVVSLRRSAVSEDDVWKMRKLGLITEQQAKWVLDYHFGAESPAKKD